QHPDHEVRAHPVEHRGPDYDPEDDLEHGRRDLHLREEPEDEGRGERDRRHDDDSGEGDVRHAVRSRQRPRRYDGGSAGLGSPDASGRGTYRSAPMTKARPNAERTSLAELLAGLSLVTDLARGHAPEEAVRACALATGLARGLGLGDDEAR